MNQYSLLHFLVSTHALSIIAISDEVFVCLSFPFESTMAYWICSSDLVILALNGAVLTPSLALCCLWPRLEVAWSLRCASGRVYVMRVSGVWLVCVGWLPARAANCSNPPPLIIAASMKVFGQIFGFLCWLPNKKALVGFCSSFR